MSKLNSERLNSFGSASIPKLVLQFSVPAIISMLVNALYNVVDRFFVGQGVGSLGIAGITLCFPICLFIMAMSMMVGVGGNTLFAIRLGQKKYIQASIILNNSFSLLILMALGTFTLGEIFMEPLLKLFGASEQTLPVASSYMRILLCGAVFQTIAPGMNHFIRSMGHPKTAMFREIVGAVTNIILDYLFIMQFHWGIEGAAWATISSQLVASALITQFFIKKGTPIRIRWRHMKLRAAYVRKIYILGLPPSVMQICNSLMNAILAWSLTTYGNISVKTTGTLSGGDMAISAFGITNSIISIIILPLLGFVHGTQPIIGYNYGARLNARANKIGETRVVMIQMIFERLDRRGRSAPVILAQRNEHPAEGRGLIPRAVVYVLALDNDLFGARQRPVRLAIAHACFISAVEEVAVRLIDVNAVSAAPAVQIGLRATLRPDGILFPAMARMVRTLAEVARIRPVVLKDSKFGVSHKFFERIEIVLAPNGLQTRADAISRLRIDDVVFRIAGPARRGERIPAESAARLFRFQTELAVGLAVVRIGAL